MKANIFLRTCAASDQKKLLSLYVLFYNHWQCTCQQIDICEKDTESFVICVDLTDKKYILGSLIHISHSIRVGYAFMGVLIFDLVLNLVLSVRKCLEQCYSKIIYC